MALRRFSAPLASALCRTRDAPLRCPHAGRLTNLVITGSLVSILPLALGFAFLQRYWRQGSTLGSVVG